MLIATAALVATTSPDGVLHASPSCDTTVHVSVNLLSQQTMKSHSHTMPGRRSTSNHAPVSHRRHGARRTHYPVPRFESARLCGVAEGVGGGVVGNTVSHSA